ncbi:succinate dehydrogenase [ubiquinone] cytochrome b small subunit, mitochondrial-like isoform X2 [Diabrotica virgifera virgifera]|nr:succinate dehydrogenase [ubiquinone] cytochrome b small subunit, mitochondrial-like isoform X2 [Diabrotica virgifera virgifera]
MSGNHAKIWPFEKLVTLSLVGLVPATFITPNAVLDDIFAAIMCLHMHWGLESCLTDYVRPIIFGPLIPKIALLLLYLVSLGTLASLLNYNHNDIGIGATFQKIWQMEAETSD